MNQPSTKIKKIAGHVLDLAGEKIPKLILENDQVFQVYVQTLVQEGNGQFADSMLKGLQKLFAFAMKRDMAKNTNQVYLQILQQIITYMCDPNNQEKAFIYSSTIMDMIQLAEK